MADTLFKDFTAALEAVKARKRDLDALAEQIKAASEAYQTAVEQAADLYRSIDAEIALLLPRESRVRVK